MTIRSDASVHNFVQCPFCAGHESVSPEALADIAKAIQFYIDKRGSWVDTELYNVMNDILNRKERETTPPWESPICPTPTKRKYSNLEHAHHDAVRWNQHPYTCVCTYVHLSKQTPEEHAAKISTPPATADEFEDAIDPLLT